MKFGDDFHLASESLEQGVRCLMSAPTSTALNDALDFPAAFILDERWRNTIEQYAIPYIGDLPINEIDTPQIIKCLEPIWLEKNETASRLRGRIEQVLDWTKVSGFRDSENPARWRGHLDKLLPKPSKVQKVEHRLITGKPRSSWRNCGNKPAMRRDAWSWQS